MTRLEELTKTAARTALEDTLAAQIRMAGLPNPVREYKFLLDRGYRFDFVWLDKMVAVEVEGGVWSGGRHVRPAGYQADMDKYNLAAAAGFAVYRFGAEAVKDGTALAFIENVLKETP